MGNVITDMSGKVVAELVAQINALVTDITALRAWANTHQHSALNAAPTTTDGALTTTAVVLNK